MYVVDAVGPVTVGRADVRMGRMGMRVHLYYVDGLLVDTGPRRLADGFRRFVELLPGVEQVVLTHLHEDHSGMASEAVAAGIPVYCHREAAPHTTRPVGLPLYRTAFWRTPRPFVSRPLPERVETERYRFDVIPTPGHAAEHVVLHEPSQGWLFSGDLYLGTRVRTIMREESLPTLMQSIRRVLQLDFDTLFCAHVGPVPDGKAALQAKLDHLEELADKVRELAEQGLSVRAAAKRLFPAVQPMTIVSMGEYSPLHVVRSLWPDELRDAAEKEAV